MADREKYPIGTKIKFIASEKSCFTAKQDDGKEGEVVNYMGGLIGIYLPKSGNNSRFHNKQTTWLTRARNLQILPQKNQQLEFNFMV